MDHLITMKLHLLTLKFSGDSSDLEAPFERDFFKILLPHNRFAMIVGALFYSLFGILDAVLMPENKSAIWLIRFAIVDPAIIGIFLISYFKWYEQYANQLMTSLSILAGGGIIGMIVIAVPPVNYSYYAGLLLVFIWIYAFMRIPFLYATFTGWVIVVLYEIAAIWIKPTPLPILINNNFFFISANIMGMIACYSLEYYTRRNFFLTQQIEMEREKIDRINRELESQTVEYQNINQTLKQEINERRKAEEALLESEELYRTALENSNDGVVIIQDGRYVYVNEKFLNKIGMSRDELMSSKIDNIIHPDDRIFLMDYFNKSPQEQAMLNHFETRLVLSDNTIRYADVSLAEVTYKGEKAILAYARDITERKRMEEERHHYEKLHGVLEIAGAVCHEMNQPIQIISGYSEMLLMDMSVNDPIRNKIETISRQIDRMAIITKQLMNIKDFETKDYAGISRIVDIKKSSNMGKA